MLGPRPAVCGPVSGVVCSPLSVARNPRRHLETLPNQRRLRPGGREAGRLVAGARHKAVRHTAQKIKKFRDFITWLFAFGLVGLGMQITFASIKQAGGQPLIIGGVVGTLKAVLSLIVVMLFVHETI